VEALAGAEYELRLTNPFPARVAVAVSVDGLNVIDARHTTAWEASKWVIHPYGTLTLSGWQVGTERARRFYFTSERDAYATRIGRPGEFGIISAVFYRERRTVSDIIPRHMGESELRNSVGATAAGDASARRAPGDTGPSTGRPAPSRRYYGRAATGIGSYVPSEVQEVSMELERHPIEIATLHYDFRHWLPPPSIVPGFAPDTGERGWSIPRSEGRFAPEP
jgi:hypothetical protein